MPNKIQTIIAVLQELAAIYQQLDQAGFFQSLGWKDKLEALADESKFPQTTALAEKLHDCLGLLPGVEHELNPLPPSNGQ